jgi:hypothetical protein
MKGVSTSRYSSQPASSEAASAAAIVMTCSGP